MGRKSEKTSDPSLAKPHEKGTPVHVIQVAEHAAWGTISYARRELWILHYRLAVAGFRGVEQVQTQVLQLPIQSSNARFLGPNDRPDLLLAMYDTGSRMILNTVLTMQHFSQEIEAYFGVPAHSKGSVEDRIKNSYDLAPFSVPCGGPGYSAFHEILSKRDAIEHPNSKNVFNSHPNDWDRVPLAWLLTERAPRAFRLWLDWFHQAADAWMEYKKDNTQTITLHVSARGVKSVRQAKNPPKS